MKWFIDGLTQYATFSGRASRKAYWYYVLFYIFFAIIIAIIARQMDINSIYAIRFFEVAFFIPSLAVGVRRMHDVNKSGWYLLIPIYNLILACMPGTTGYNVYGPDPQNNIVYGAADYEKPYDVNANGIKK